MSASRAGTSTAVRVDGAVYLFDCGMGSIRNYRDHADWGELRGVFLTHHHSDHIYDLGAYLVTGWEVPGESFARPIEVHGPDSPSHRPAMSDDCDSSSTRASGGPAMTSTVEIVDALLDRVFASDIAVRMVDEGRSDPHEWIRARNIEVPESAEAHPVNRRHPEMEPFIVYEDEMVSISAILVDHRLCFPAFGFRIDSQYGSVAISGDTAVSRNLERLACGVDLLVHEVMDLPGILRTFPDGPTRDGIEVHLRESHTSYTEVGKLARQADAKSLVLNHVVPNTPGAADLTAMRSTAVVDFGGPVVVAEDNDVFEVRTDSMTSLTRSSIQREEAVQLI